MQLNAVALAGYGTPQMSNEASWAAVRGGAGESLGSYTFIADKIGAGNFSGCRTLLFFDTHLLANSKIISAKLVHPPIANFSNLDSGSVHIVTHAAPSTTIVTGDYDSGIGTTSFGSVALSSLSTTLTTDITLNADGIAAINKTGNTPIALLSSFDFNNSEPASNGNEYTADRSLFELVVVYKKLAGILEVF